MRDVLVLVAISVPWLVGLAAVAWGVLSVCAGFLVGAVIEANERPYDWDDDGGSEPSWVKLPPLDMNLNQVWECPRCGFLLAVGAPAVLGPPTCQMGHEPVECEQKTVEAFGAGSS